MSEAKEISILFNKLNQAPYFNFPQKRQNLEAPTERGVYIIFSPLKKVLHVGCTPRALNGLWQRLKDHLSGQSSFIEKYLKDSDKLRKGYFYKFITVNSARKIKLLEAYAIGQLCPEHIGEG